MSPNGKRTWLRPSGSFISFRVAEVEIGKCSVNCDNEWVLSRSSLKGVSSLGLFTNTRELRVASVHEIRTLSVGTTLAVGELEGVNEVVDFPDPARFGRWLVFGPKGPSVVILDVRFGGNVHGPTQRTGS